MSNRSATDARTLFERSRTNIGIRKAHWAGDVERCDEVQVSALGYYPTLAYSPAPARIRHSVSDVVRSSATSS